MEKVSVIVPIYNVQNYLDDCIKSLVRQDYSNLEILLVNDGSTDQSLKICEQYASQDQRIRIVNEVNQGRGAARNRGIDCATADLLTFVDGDDFVTPNYVSTLIKQKAKFHSNIAQTSYIVYKKKLDNYYELTRPRLNNHSLDGAYLPAAWLQTYPFLDNGMTTQVGSRLFERQLFDSIRFPENHLPFEDAYTSWRVTLKASRVSFENKGTYVVVGDRPDSITHTDKYGAEVHAIRALEEEISVMNLANLDTANLLANYLNHLQKLTKMSLEQGDYAVYLRTKSKLSIINQYRSK